MPPILGRAHAQGIPNLLDMLYLHNVLITIGLVMIGGYSNQRMPLSFRLLE